jgi:hypothetical protein
MYNTNVQVWDKLFTLKQCYIVLQMNKYEIHKYQAILFITSFSIGNQKQSHNAIITFILEFSNFLKKSQQGLTSQMKVICIMHITIRLF